MSICQDMHGYARIGPREHVLRKANIWIYVGVNTRVSYVSSKFPFNQPVMVTILSMSSMVIQMLGWLQIST
jgi:hypothetical protein